MEQGREAWVQRPQGSCVHTTPRSARAAPRGQREECGPGDISRNRGPPCAALRVTCQLALRQGLLLCLFPGQPMVETPRRKKPYMLRKCAWWY